MDTLQHNGHCTNDRGHGWRLTWGRLTSSFAKHLVLRFPFTDLLLSCQVLTISFSKMLHIRSHREHTIRETSQEGNMTLCDIPVKCCLLHPQKRTKNTVVERQTRFYRLPSKWLSAFVQMEFYLKTRSIHIIVHVMRKANSSCQFTRSTTDNYGRGCVIEILEKHCLHYYYWLLLLHRNMYTHFHYSLPTVPCCMTWNIRL